MDKSDISYEMVKIESELSRSPEKGNIKVKLKSYANSEREELQKLVASVFISRGSGWKMVSDIARTYM